MKLDIRAATAQERLYCERQSSQIAGQTGYIGVLNGSLGDSQEAFSMEWKDSGHSFRTETFDKDLDEIVNALRFEDANARLLQERNTANLFCGANSENASAGKYAFRIDYGEISCFLSLAPQEAGQNFQIRCYVKKWLDSHMEKARMGIRFITPDYKELFRVPDGETVRVIAGDGKCYDNTARYIDECHLELLSQRSGYSELFHICQLAEMLKRSGRTVIPIRSTLPEKCYGILPDTCTLILIQHGERRYDIVDPVAGTKEEAHALAEAHNRKLGVTRAQAAAMLAGVTLGWAAPEADPKHYEETGKMLRPKRSTRGMER